MRLQQTSEVVFSKGLSSCLVESSKAIGRPQRSVIAGVVCMASRD